MQILDGILMIKMQTCEEEKKAQIRNECQELKRGKYGVNYMLNEDGVILKWMREIRNNCFNFSLYVLLLSSLRKVTGSVILQEYLIY